MRGEKGYRRVEKKGGSLRLHVQRRRGYGSENGEHTAQIDSPLLEKNKNAPRRIHKGGGLLQGGGTAGPRTFMRVGMGRREAGRGVAGKSLS